MTAQWPEARSSIIGAVVCDGPPPETIAYPTTHHGFLGMTSPEKRAVASTPLAAVLFLSK